jgi:hypothetical protein
MGYMWVTFPLYSVRMIKLWIEKFDQWIHPRDFFGIIWENYVGDKYRNYKKQFQLRF